MQKVEFIALPGAGKSLLYNSIFRQMKDNGLDVFSENDLFFSGKLGSYCRRIPQKIQNAIRTQLVEKFNILEDWSVRFNENNEALFDLISNACRTMANEEEMSFCHRATMNTFCMHEMATHKLPENSIFIVDGGLYHRLITLFVSLEKVVDYPTIENYINLLPNNIILLYIEVRRDIAIDRKKRQNRLPARLKERAPERIDLFFQKAESAIKFAIQAIPKKNASLIRINNDGAVSDAVGELKSKLLSSLFLK